MLTVTVYASGSKGNCTSVSDGRTTLFIDCGLTLKELRRRANALGAGLPDASGVLVTHSHTDHCCGVAALSAACGAPVYVHQTGLAALLAATPRLAPVRTQVFSGAFTVGTLSVTPFLVSHDTACCCGYVVRGGGESAGFATDLGVAGADVLAALSGCGGAVLESNHDIAMLRLGRYPHFLKNRILSASGHLSNDACAELAAELVARGLKKLCLAHLSEENNLPELAFDTVNRAIAGRGYREGRDYTLDVAAQHRPIRLILNTDKTATSFGVFSA